MQCRSLDLLCFSRFDWMQLLHALQREQEAPTVVRASAMVKCKAQYEEVSDWIPRFSQLSEALQRKQEVLMVDNAAAMVECEAKCEEKAAQRVERAHEGLIEVCVQATTSMSRPCPHSRPHHRPQLNMMCTSCLLPDAITHIDAPAHSQAHVHAHCSSSFGHLACFLMLSISVLSSSCTLSWGGF